MNGEISVQSTKGVGSTFSITLPCVTDELTTLNVSTAPPPPATTTNFNQSSTTLVNALIVDDNLVNRYIFYIYKLID